MKTIIAGSRAITDYQFIKYNLNNLGFYFDITEVVCGMAKGADLLGKQWAEENNIPVKEFPADWDKYGRRAGYIRNVEMAEYADALVAFWDGKSMGTQHMIDIAKKLDLKRIDIITI